jgi:hypothetical protein
VMAKLVDSKTYKCYKLTFVRERDIPATPELHEKNTGLSYSFATNICAVLGCIQFSCQIVFDR